MKFHTFHSTIQMSGRGHRKLRLCSRKNYEKKKYHHPPAIPVQPVHLTDVSVLTVSLPLDLLPLRVSLPLSALEVIIEFITILSQIHEMSYCQAERLSAASRASVASAVGILKDGSSST